MSEELLVRNCAPTLAGLKTGNLFSCPYTCREEVLDFLRRFNRRLGHKGIRAIPLRFSGKKALIYLYRPSRLEEDLSKSLSGALLRQCGYSCQDGNGCLRKLAQRLRQQENFPHEIGLFLSYPAEDVQGFLEHRPCKCTGCWKVYENEEKAQKTFAMYRTCTKIYCQQYAKGTNMERLTVASQTIKKEGT